ncbi:MAG: hypothetical protein ACYDBJ_28480 [Aggregatilineales bacterium]
MDKPQPPFWPGLAHGNRFVTTLIQRAQQRTVIVPDAALNGGVIQRVKNAAEMGAHYGLGIDVNIPNDGGMNQLFEDQKDTILPWLEGSANQKRTKLYNIKRYLTNAGQPYADAFANLSAFNAYFGAKEHQIGPNHDMVNVTEGTALTAALQLIIGPLKNVLVEIYRTKGIAEVLALYRSPLRFAALNAVSPGPTGDQAAKHLGVIQLDQLQTVRANHGPGTGFAGGMVWGRGELPSIPDNQLAHFKKHCLRQYQADANPDQHEPWKWMGILGYTITKNYVEAHAGALGDDESTNIFGTGTQITSQDQANFFFNTYLSTKPGLTAQLVNDYMPLYIDHVRNATQSLSAPFISVNSGKIQIVGTQGQQFIVGKWDAGAFTISSSYLNVGKVVENEPFKLWNL